MVSIEEDSWTYVREKVSVSLARLGQRQGWRVEFKRDMRISAPGSGNALSVGTSLAWRDPLSMHQTDARLFRSFREGVVSGVIYHRVFRKRYYHEGFHFRPIKPAPKTSMTEFKRGLKTNCDPCSNARDDRVICLSALYRNPTTRHKCASLLD